MKKLLGKVIWFAFLFVATAGGADGAWLISIVYFPAVRLTSSSLRCNDIITIILSILLNLRIKTIGPRVPIVCFGADFEQVLKTMSLVLAWQWMGGKKKKKHQFQFSERFCSFCTGRKVDECPFFKTRTCLHAVAAKHWETSILTYICVWHYFSAIFVASLCACAAPASFLTF